MFIFCKNKNTIFLLLQVTTLIQGSNATLMIDGWSNLKNEPVIGVAFMAKGKCYLANTIDTLGTQHTSENLVQIVKEQIEHCESNYKVNITSLVCDNAANMVSIRKQLADDIGLHVFGCNAHYANLLAKDICNSSGGKSVLAKITDIINTCESIVNLAVAIVGGASSSGGLERHFSSLGFSYGTLRAQLGIEKAGKLAFLYRELNQ